MVDLGLNNISSVVRLLNATGINVEISIVDKYILKNYAHFVILPGIGNFGAACEIIEQNDIDYFLTEQVKLGSFVTGICLGMQLLGDTSSESPNSKGLGIIDGTSAKFEPKAGFPVPHVGWNSVKLTKKDTIDALGADLDFYFTHSYYF